MDARQYEAIEDLMVHDADDWGLVAWRPPWMAHAACRGRDTALWFPERGEPTAEAVGICRTCTVAEPCLDYALGYSGSLSGIWGGVSGRGRMALRRRAA